MPGKSEQEIAKQLRLTKLKDRFMAGTILCFGMLWALVLGHQVGTLPAAASPTSTTTSLSQPATVTNPESQASVPQPSPGLSNGATQTPLLRSSAS